MCERLGGAAESKVYSMNCRAPAVRYHAPVSSQIAVELSSSIFVLEAPSWRDVQSNAALHCEIHAALTCG